MRLPSFCVIPIRTGPCCSLVFHHKGFARNIFSCFPPYRKINEIGHPNRNSHIWEFRPVFQLRRVLFRAYGIPGVCDPLNSHSKLPFNPPLSVSQGFEWNFMFFCFFFVQPIWKVNSSIIPSRDFLSQQRNNTRKSTFNVRVDRLRNYH